MLRSKKLWTMLTVATLAMGCLWMVPSKATGASGSKGVTCVIDVVVQTGPTLQTTYHKEFTLLEGETFSDDFSSATRMRFFDASLTKVSGEWIMDVDWYADTTTFNTVEMRTAAIIPKGQKSTKTAGTHNFWNSTTSSETGYSVVCTVN